MRNRQAKVDKFKRRKHYDLRSFLLIFISKIADRRQRVDLMHRWRRERERERRRNVQLIQLDFPLNLNHLNAVPTIRSVSLVSSLITFKQSNAIILIEHSLSLWCLHPIVDAIEHNVDMERNSSSIIYQSSKHLESRLHVCHFFTLIQIEQFVMQSIITFQSFQFPLMPRPFVHEMPKQSNRNN